MNDHTTSKILRRRGAVMENEPHPVRISKLALRDKLLWDNFHILLLCDDSRKLLPQRFKTFHLLLRLGVIFDSNLYSLLSLFVKLQLISSSLFQNLSIINEDIFLTTIFLCCYITYFELERHLLFSTLYSIIPSIRGRYSLTRGQNYFSLCISIHVFQNNHS